MTAPELARYARQMIYPAIGEAGQRALAASRVLLVGCGALGTHLAAPRQRDQYRRHPGSSPATLPDRESVLQPARAAPAMLRSRSLLYFGKY